jgi:dipeptidyl aminopeptidase/acylaminoacyl peptidase
VAGVPRWSPDGRWLAFDARPDGSANIFVVGSEGSGLRRLTNSRSEDARPNWSRDGRTVFFSSNRAGGAPRIWRVPAGGGDPVQVSTQSGYGLRISPDGEWIYYTAGAVSGELRRMHPDGSGDNVVLSLPVLGLAYTVMPSGVYAVVQRGPSRPYFSVQFLSTAGKLSEVLNPGFAPTTLGLSLTPDERYLLLTHPDDKGTDLMLVENFR